MVLAAKELGYFPSPYPCPQRIATSYSFLHPHLLPSRLNFFEVNGYNRLGDVGTEWNLSHASSISIKLHGSWKIKGKDLGAKHILGFIEPHFGFPNAELGHSIHEARLWSKSFQGWNQSYGTGTYKTKVRGCESPFIMKEWAIAFYECFHYFEIRNLLWMRQEYK